MSTYLKGVSHPGNTLVDRLLEVPYTYWKTYTLGGNDINKTFFGTQTGNIHNRIHTLGVDIGKLKTIRDEIISTHKRYTIDLMHETSDITHSYYIRIYNVARGVIPSANRVAITGFNNAISYAKNKIKKLIEKEKEKGVVMTLIGLQNQKIRGLLNKMKKLIELSVKPYVISSTAINKINSEDIEYIEELWVKATYAMEREKVLNRVIKVLEVNVNYIYHFSNYMIDAFWGGALLLVTVDKKNVVWGSNPRNPLNTQNKNTKFDDLDTNSVVQMRAMVGYRRLYRILKEVSDDMKSTWSDMYKIYIGDKLSNMKIKYNTDRMKTATKVAQLTVKNMEMAFEKKYTDLEGLLDFKLFKVHAGLFAINTDNLAITIFTHKHIDKDYYRVQQELGNLILYTTMYAYRVIPEYHLWPGIKVIDKTRANNGSLNRKEDLEMLSYKFAPYSPQNAIDSNGTDAQMYWNGNADPIQGEGIETLIKTGVDEFFQKLDISDKKYDFLRLMGRSTKTPTPDTMTFKALSSVKMMTLIVGLGLDNMLLMPDNKYYEISKDSVTLYTDFTLKIHEDDRQSKFLNGFAGLFERMKHTDVGGLIDIPIEARLYEELLDQDVILLDAIKRLKYPFKGKVTNIVREQVNDESTRLYREMYMLEFDVFKTDRFKDIKLAQFKAEVKNRVRDLQIPSYATDTGTSNEVIAINTKILNFRAGMNSYASDTERALYLKKYKEGYPEFAKSHSGIVEQLEKKMQMYDFLEKKVDFMVGESPLGDTTNIAWVFKTELLGGAKLLYPIVVTKNLLQTRSMYVNAFENALKYGWSYISGYASTTHSDLKGFYFAGNVTEDGVVLITPPPHLKKGEKYNFPGDIRVSRSYGLTPEEYKSVLALGNQLKRGTEPPEAYLDDPETMKEYIFYGVVLPVKPMEVFFKNMKVPYYRKNLWESFFFRGPLASFYGFFGPNALLSGFFGGRHVYNWSKKDLLRLFDWSRDKYSDGDEDASEYKVDKYIERLKEGMPRYRLLGIRLLTKLMKAMINKPHFSKLVEEALETIWVNDSEVRNLIRAEARGVTMVALAPILTSDITALTSTFITGEVPDKFTPIPMDIDDDDDDSSSSDSIDYGDDEDM